MPNTLAANAAPARTVADSAETIARILEPQAWAALGIGDTLAYKNRRTSSLRKAGVILAQLQRHRDSVIEECAQVVRDLTDKWGNPNGTLYEQGAQDHGHRIHARISSLKGAR